MKIKMDIMEAFILIISNLQKETTLNKNKYLRKAVNIIAKELGIKWKK